MTAKRELQDRLNACLDRLQRGGTVEECLALYAQDAAELEPLLRTAHLTMRAAAAARPGARAELLGHLSQAWQERHARPSRRLFATSSMDSVRSRSSPRRLRSRTMAPSTVSGAMPSTTTAPMSNRRADCAPTLSSKKTRE